MSRDEDASIARTVRTLERLHELSEGVRRHVDELLSFGNVRHVDVGWRWRNGRRTRALAVRLFVDGPKVEMAAPGLRLAPRRLHGLPVDVIRMCVHSGTCVPGHPRRVVAAHPLAGGFSLAGDGTGAPGTIGAVLRNDAGEALGVTARHVVNGATDHVVFQPAPADAPAVARPIGHRVESNPPWDVSVFWIDPGVDAAVGAVADANQITGIVSRDELFVLARDRARVVLSGRSTPRVAGVVEGVRDQPSSVLEGSTSVVTIAPRSPSVAVFTRGGDSGAAWITPDGRLVALHTAGSVPPGSPHAFATAAWLFATKWRLGA